jgi:hypothetical protein
MIDPALDEESSGPVSNGVLRQFAVLWILLLGLLAYWQGIITDNPSTAAWVYAGLAIVPGVAGLVIPKFIRPVFVGLQIVTAPLGWLMSHLLLAVLFYGIFSPVALAFRLIGRDALARRFRPDLQTYWNPKPPATSPKSYFHPY